jgi:Stress responsive A/B Barrel Domain
MMTHTVFFWLRTDLSGAGRTEFEAGLRTLLTIPGSSRALIGQPAATPKRDVIDDSYDYALELDFPSLAVQDLYQAHPVHQAFVESQSVKWQRVQVYDFAWV